MTLLGYFGSAVAIALITMQIIHVIQSVQLLIQPRVEVTRHWLGPHTRVFQGLTWWEISVLIGLSLLGICVSAMLLIGSLGILTLQASALNWLRRYALWQTATVMPTAAVVAWFSEGIAFYDYHESSARTAELVCQWALIQAAIAIIWSIIILRVITLPRAFDYWQKIEEEDRVPLARVADSGTRRFKMARIVAKFGLRTRSEHRE